MMYSLKCKLRLLFIHISHLKGLIAQRFRSSCSNRSIRVSTQEFTYNGRECDVKNPLDTREKTLNHYVYGCGCIPTWVRCARLSLAKIHFQAAHLLDSTFRTSRSSYFELKDDRSIVLLHLSWPTSAVLLRIP